MIIVLLQIVQSRKVELYSKHKLTATIVGNIQLQTWPIAFISLFMLLVLLHFVSIILLTQTISLILELCTLTHYI